MKTFLCLAAIFGFLSVAIGAFGAHSLDNWFKTRPDLSAPYHTGTHYQMFHCMALFAVAILFNYFPDPKLLKISGWLFAAGIVLFSGSLYIYGITGIKSWGLITPVGGLCFLAGWVCLLLQALKIKIPA
jgi:uncharacterized membrane protein YgdD (TMEM256/DUF423 family)